MTEGKVMEIWLSHKLAAIYTIADNAMLWWVSTVVFCAVIMAAVWKERDHLVNARFFPWLRWILGSFFVSIVLFGVGLIFGVIRLLEDVSVLLAAGGLEGKYIKMTEFWLTVGGLSLGTFTFLLVCLAWFWLCSEIKKHGTHSS